MRMFIVYKDNRIVSVSKVTIMPDDQVHSYGQLGDGEKIYEIPDNLIAQFENLDVLEIHNNYQVTKKRDKISLEKKK